MNLTKYIGGINMEKKLVLSCEYVIFDSYGRQESKNITPVFLRYYELISDNKGENDARDARYGVGIEKITQDSAVTLCESQFIEDVFTCPTKCKKFLNSLSENKVTPTTLRDIVIDTIA